MCAQFRQSGVGLPREQLLQAGFAGFGQEGLAAAAVGLRLQRPSGFEVLAHPAHGGDALAEAGGNLAGALALVVELEDAFTHGDRDSFHAPSLPQPSPM